MIITFFRSSSLSQYIDMCHQQYFITYVLGQPSPPNMKADLGSITHLALEWLSLLKIQYDKGNERLKLKTSAIDLDIDREDIYIPTSLKDSDIDKINYSRRNKQIYLPTARLPYGQVRYGSKVVNKLITDSYTYFSTVVSPDHPWTNASYKQAWNWTWMALEQNNRAYDPRFRTIIAPEQKFDLKIEKDWAKYEFYLKGEKIEGYLGLKGTIDLVTKVDDDTIEIIDWKGLPLDTPLPTPNGWTTMGEVQIGDILFDISGNRTKVVGKSKVKTKPCYEILFNDGCTVICDNEHLWRLTDSRVVKITDLKIGDKIDVANSKESIAIHNHYKEYVNKYNLTYREIVEIIPILKERKTQCISVDSPTSTYLCTENMIPTHNTGKMFNWGKNEAKTFESLHEDKQLMFYYYAARQIFPQYKNIIITINFIRDGGAQTIVFDDSILEETENMIRQTFEEIKANEKPKLLDPTYNDHRCRLFCPFFKKKIGTTPYCRYVADRIDELGIEYVTDTEMREGFTPGYYESPGE